jgi:GT2 family glycosyltransferase
MKKRIGISVIIPNWNGRELLRKNLPFLIEAMDYYGGEYEIIVVDDASTDGSFRFIKETYPWMRIVRLEQNRGFSVAVNRGVYAAEYNMVLLLNSDIRVKRNFLSPLLGYFDDDRTFAVTNRTMKDENTVLSRASIPEFKYGFLREVYTQDENKPSFAFGASGGHGLFDREKFIQLGGFDDVYTPFYYEDADLSYRAWKRGYRVYYEPRSCVYHHHQATIGKAFSKGYINFVFNRNRLIFLWKNLTDVDLLIQNFLFLPLNLLLNSIKNPRFFLSFLAALLKAPMIIKSRRKEKAFIQHGDKEILKLIKEG